MKHLTGNYYIEADEYCFTITEKSVLGENSKNAGEEVYKPVSHHATPQQVSDKLCRLGVLEYVNKDWKQCVDFVTEAHLNFIKELRNGFSRNTK